LKALIIVAHGSRKQEANHDVIHLSEQILERINADYKLVAAAFLQFAEPLLGTQIDTMVGKGATHITIFPFFIGAGNHLKVDIPALVTRAREKYPQVSIEVTRHLGKIKGIKEIIINEVTKI